MKHEALRLPEGQKAVLIEKLIESISPIDKDIQKSWVKECDDRMAALDNGKISTIDGAEAIKSVRSSLRA
jgi:hypothetical protein